MRYGKERRDRASVLVDTRISEKTNKRANERTIASQDYKMTVRLLVRSCEQHTNKVVNPVFQPKT
ncbi:hypothetical protein WN48_02095 [Eufriesea mexicana]|nr:hypothetical protein WN48_02095 [Eufriesea mexicana]